MTRYAANLSTMYREHDFSDRFGAAARDGFTAVELMFPYPYPARRLGKLLQEHGLRQVLFNSPPGDWNAGDRGCAAIPGREAEFREGFCKAVEYASVLECPRIHAMAGLMPQGANRARFRATYLENLAWAAERAAQAGVDVLIEPIAQRNIPGYFLNRQEEAHAIVAELGKPNLKVMMDLFHCQMAEGDLTGNLRRYLGARPSRVGHIQVASVPGRHEPDAGEINYPYVFELIDELGYSGWIGLEYIPKGSTSEGLGWLDAQSAMAH
ncbi:MAG: 2-oxo-tetronate isomerase [Acidobacteriota bacterium]